MCAELICTINSRESKVVVPRETTVFEEAVTQGILSKGWQEVYDLSREKYDQYSASDHY